MLDKAIECVPAETYPLETICIGFASNDLRVMDLIDLYYKAGQPDKARALGVTVLDEGRFLELLRGGRTGTEAPAPADGAAAGTAATPATPADGGMDALF